jgi:hypothetical protein
MDSRPVVTPEVFFELLKGFHTGQTHLHLLVDDDGLTRKEGIIRSITPAEATLMTKFTLDNGYSFLLNQLIAVNGIFRSDYSEC